MANDDPYHLDFLQQITDVHFTAPTWIMISMFANNGNSPSLATTRNLTVDFPQIAGGTPGFNLVLGSTPISTVRNKVVTAKDLSNALTTAAGQHLTGFTMGCVSPAGAPFAVLGAVFLSCSGPFRNAFELRVDGLTTGVTNNIASHVSLWKSAIKVGAKLSFDSVFGSFPPADAQDNKNASGSPPVTLTGSYAIDPKKLTVVAS